MNSGYFVTGTDTGIGKTVVSACLCLALQGSIQRVAYMKPVQTGCDTAADGRGVPPDPAFVLSATGFTPDPDEVADVCPVSLRLPASPHLAAAEQSRLIDVSALVAAFNRLQTRYEQLVVEGAGGVMVPLNDKATILDLIQALALPAVVVARSGLGTINHTWLTLDTLRRAGVAVAGVVLVDTTDQPPGLIEADNARVIAARGRVPVLAHLPYDAATARGIVNPAYLKEQAERLRTQLTVQ